MLDDLNFLNWKQMKSVTKHIWKSVFFQKKRTIKNTFKISLISNQQEFSLVQNQTENVNTVRLGLIKPNTV